MAYNSCFFLEFTTILTGQMAISGRYSPMPTTLAKFSNTGPAHGFVELEAVRFTVSMRAQNAKTDTENSTLRESHVKTAK